MSQAGNIKGSPGSSGFVPSRASGDGSPGRGDRPGMEREERTRIGRSPLDMGRGDRPGVEREERTRIGRSPLDPGTTTSGGRPAPEGESPRTNGPRETKGGGIDFSQDELMPRETPRTERPREGKSAEVFESSPSTDRPRTRGRTEEGGAHGSDFESSRPSGERPQVPTRARDAADASSGEFDAPPELGAPAERPQVPTRARDAADASSGEFDVPHDVDDPWASAERPQVPTRTRDAADVSSGGFDVPRELEEPRAPGGRPQVPDQPRSAEDAASGFEAPSDLGTPEAPPRGPGRGRGADGQSTGVFEAPRGEAGSRTVRGDRLPNADTLFESRPSTRSGGRPALPSSEPGSQAASTTGLPGARGEVASLEELLPDLSGIVGQEALAEHFAENLLLLPPRQSPASRSLRLWAMFTAYAEANARNPMGQTPAGRQAFAETLIANGFAALRDVRTGRDGVEVALELLDAPSLEEFHAQLDQVHMEPGLERLPTEVSLPVAEEPRTPEQPEARKEAAARQAQAQGQRGPEQKEKEAERAPPTAGQAGVQASGTQQAQALAAGPLAPRDPRQEWEEEKKERERRGTNKRLGPQLLWSVLHELRASPEDSAVLKEKWSQLAFGAVVCLMGAALLVAMLASL
ncbi:hypothetical protein [Cystobacter fuscus]|uniref:hypothetical protein n=1 Tax=Cystobacter fuscus TaxID=43 RepID=UPI0012FE6E06|nr:hypothetical protein [Cystobacter fuscus]